MSSSPPRVLVAAAALAFAAAALALAAAPASAQSGGSSAIAAAPASAQSGGSSALAAAPASAQSGGRAARSHTVELVPYAGYLIADSYVTGPLGTDLKSANGAVYGVQLGVPLGGAVSLFGNVAYSGTDLQAGVPILGGVSAGRSAETLYDGGLQIGTPAPASGGAVSPFLQVGAGAIHRKLTVAGITAGSTDFAFNAGIGVDVGVVRGVGLRLMAKDYIGKLDLGTDAIPVKTGPIHNVSLSAGLKVEF